MLPPIGAVALGEKSVHASTNATDLGGVSAVVRDLRPAVGGPGGVVDAWMSLQDASQYLGVCDRTIRRMVKTGKLPHRRIGRLLRFKRADLDRLLEVSAATVEAISDFINQNTAKRGTS